MTEQPKAQLRLAMRAEGTMWNFYAALTDTMDNAILLGSMRLAVANDPVMKADFVAIMKRAFEACLREIGIKGDLSWPGEVRPAPLHERGGNA